MINNNAWIAINELVSRAAGIDDAAIVDDKSLIDFGRKLSDTNADTFKNNLANEIANKVRLSLNLVRKYDGKLQSLIRGQMPANSVLEIIQNNFFNTRSADFVNLVDEQSVDMYKVAKGGQTADYFVDENAFKLFVTIQSVEIEGAFMSGDAMQAFLTGKITYLVNSYNLAREQGRRVMIASEIKDLSAAAAATTPDSLAQRYPLCTLYNTVYAYKTGDAGFVDKANAMYDSNFIKFAIMIINKIHKKLSTPSQSFNDGSIKTFTPEGSKKLICLESLADSIVAFKTTFSPDATVLPMHETIEFWQQEKDPYVAWFLESGKNLEVVNTDADRGTVVGTYYYVIATGKTYLRAASSYTEVSNFDDGNAQTSTAPTVAVLFDEMAMGEYLTHEVTRTTPFNAAGEYYNIFMNYQGKSVRLKSANAVIFTLE